MTRQAPSSLARHLAPVRPALTAASVLAAGQNLLWLVQAWAVAAGVAGVLAPPAVLSPFAAAAVFLATGAVRAGLTLVADGMLFRAADRVLAGLRAQILKREAEVGPGALGAGAVTALASEKLDLLGPYISRYRPAQARVMVVPLAILAVACWHSWAVGLIFLVTGPLIPVFMALVGMAAQAASEKQMDEIASLNDLLIDRLSALADFRLLGAAPALVQGFANRAETLRARTMAVLRIAFLSSTVLELFAAIGVAMVAVFLGFSLLGAIGFGTWGHALTPAQVIFLLVVAPEFYQPLRDLSAAWHDKAAALAVARDLDAWENATPSPAFGRGSVAMALDGVLSLSVHDLAIIRAQQRIELQNFEITAGQSLALTGPSGSGKTSLLLALTGLLRPDSGTITVCGRLLDDTTADPWRARIGWMPQTPHFLDATLRENVGFDAGAEIGAALAQAGVAHVVAALPEGEATRLGESGAGLSGGEARRVTLARALYKRPDLLIADEPTADLDAETARIVTDALLAAVAEGMAVIVATHDATLAARMDKVIEIGGAR